MCTKEWAGQLLGKNLLVCGLFSKKPSSELHQRIVDLPCGTDVPYFLLSLTLTSLSSPQNAAPLS